MTDQTPPVQSQSKQGEDDRPYEVRLLNGPAAGTTFERWSPEDAQWVQRDEHGNWERVRFATLRRPDAKRYLLSALFPETRIAEYAWYQVAAKQGEGRA